MIRRLSDDVQGRLRTGVALTSVAQCVEELVLNSVDAGATCVAVRIDLQNLTVQVVDNGTGIVQEQLLYVGDRYSTSKCHTVEDLDNLKYFGYRGEALASLCWASSFVEVITRSSPTAVTYTRCFHKGKGRPVVESSTPRPGRGTTVTAHHLFYNLPVRKKSVKEGLELEKVRYRVSGLALMWPKISFSLRDDVTGNVILQTRKCSGILATFSALFGGARAKHLKEVEARDAVFKVGGFVSRENYSRKDLQFVFVNSRLVLKSKVHKVLNTVLGKSVLVRRRDRRTGQERSPDAVSPTKIFERYAVYFVNIVCPLSVYDITFDPAKTLVEFHDWSDLTKLIESMLLKFLREEHLLLPSEEAKDGGQPGTSGGTAAEEEVVPQSPDAMDETDDPFAGAEDGYDEKFHNDLQRKTYASGISTHNHLHSLFSHAVRRPVEHHEVEGFDDLGHSSPKKSRRANDLKSNLGQNQHEKVFPEATKAPRSSTDVEDVFVQNKPLRTTKETEAVRTLQFSSGNQSTSSHTLKHKPVSLPYDPIDSPDNMGDEDAEIMLPPAVGPQRRETPETCNKQTSSENFQAMKSLENPRATKSSLSGGSNFKEIRLPSQFRPSSSLTRLRARLAGEATPNQLSTPSGSTSFSGGSAASALHRFRRTQKQNNYRKNPPEDDVEFQDADKTPAEIVLPPMKRPPMFRSKSLDSGCSCCHQDIGGACWKSSKSSRRSHKAENRISDDACVSYLSRDICDSERRRHRSDESCCISKAHSLYLRPGTLKNVSSNVATSLCYSQRPSLGHSAHSKEPASDVMGMRRQQQQSYLQRRHAGMNVPSRQYMQTNETVVRHSGHDERQSLPVRGQGDPFVLPLTSGLVGRGGPVPRQQTAVGLNGDVRLPGPAMSWLSDCEQPPPDPTQRVDSTRQQTAVGLHGDVRLPGPAMSWVCDGEQPPPDPTQRVDSTRQQTAVGLHGDVRLPRPAMSWVSDREPDPTQRVDSTRQQTAVGLHGDVRLPRPAMSWVSDREQPPPDPTQRVDSTRQLAALISHGDVRLLRPVMSRVSDPESDREQPPPDPTQRMDPTMLRHSQPDRPTFRPSHTHQQTSRGLSGNGQAYLSDLGCTSQRRHAQSSQIKSPGKPGGLSQAAKLARRMRGEEVSSPDDVVQASLETDFIGMSYPGIRDTGRGSLQPHTKTTAQLKEQHPISQVFQASESLDPRNRDDNNSCDVEDMATLQNSGITQSTNSVAQDQRCDGSTAVTVGVVPASTHTLLPTTAGCQSLPPKHTLLPTTTGCQSLLVKRSVTGRREGASCPGDVAGSHDCPLTEKPATSSQGLSSEKLLLNGPGPSRHEMTLIRGEASLNPLSTHNFKAVASTSRQELSCCEKREGLSIMPGQDTEGLTAMASEGFVPDEKSFACSERGYLPVIGQNTQGFTARASEGFVPNKERVAGGERGDLPMSGQNTQGFAALASQGFVHRLAQEDSMPFATLDTVTLESSHQAQCSRSSLASQGFVPRLAWENSMAFAFATLDTVTLESSHQAQCSRSSLASQGFVPQLNNTPFAMQDTVKPGMSHKAQNNPSPLSTHSMGFSPVGRDPSLSGPEDEDGTGVVTAGGGDSVSKVTLEDDCTDIVIAVDDFSNNPTLDDERMDIITVDKDCKGLVVMDQIAGESAGFAFSEGDKAESPRSKDCEADINAAAGVVLHQNIETENENICRSAGFKCQQQKTQPRASIASKLSQICSANGDKSVYHSSPSPEDMQEEEMITSENNPAVNPADECTRLMQRGSLLPDTQSQEEGMKLSGSPEITCGQRIFEPLTASGQLSDTSEHASSELSIFNLNSSNQESQSRESFPLTQPASIALQGSFTQSTNTETDAEAQNKKHAKEPACQEDGKNHADQSGAKLCGDRVSESEHASSMECVSSVISLGSRCQPKRKLEVERTYNLSFLMEKRPKSRVSSTALPTPSSSAETLLSSVNSSVKRTDSDSLDCEEEQQRCASISQQQSDRFSDSVPDCDLASIVMPGNRCVNTATPGERSSQNSPSDSEMMRMVMPESERHMSGKVKETTPQNSQAGCQGGVVTFPENSSPVAVATKNVPDYQKSSTVVPENETSQNSVPDSDLALMVMPEKQPSSTVQQNLARASDSQESVSDTVLANMVISETEVSKKTGYVPEVTPNPFFTDSFNADASTSKKDSVMVPVSDSQTTASTSASIQASGNAFSQSAPNVSVVSEKSDIFTQNAYNLGCGASPVPTVSTPGPGSGSNIRDETQAKALWVPVTDPSSGCRMYLNSSSGHTLTQAQWDGKMMEPGCLGQRQTTSALTPRPKQPGIPELSPMSHGTLQALLADHFEAEEEETQSKWRGGNQSSLGAGQGEDSGKSVADILSSWQNPVFKRPEQIVQTSSRSQAGRVARSFFQPTSFTKQMLAAVKVVGQVDNKFIACIIQEDSKSTPSVGGGGSEREGGLVVLFDQHAAHERVRLEQLVSEVYEKGDSEERRIRRSTVKPPRAVSLSEEDVRLMQSFREEFDRIGVLFDVDKDHRDRVHLHTIPACMAQREANDMKRGKDPLSYEYVQIMIREHNQVLRSTAGARKQLPQQVHRLLATHACKGAIKFNDKLSLSTCRELLSSLSSCDLPFQCAHGRPSIAPLLSLGLLPRATHSTRPPPPNLWKLQQRMTGPAEKDQ